MEWEFISREVLADLHAESLRLFGGASGVRDENLVQSALAAAENMFWYGQGDRFDIAAASAFHIAQNQAFLDGNKRTGLAAAYTFLRLNGITTSPDQAALYDAMIGIAEKRLDKAALAALFRTLFASPT